MEKRVMSGPLYLTDPAIKNYAIPIGSGQYQSAVANRTVLLAQVRDWSFIANRPHDC